MKEFVDRESYAHKAAKEILAGWLRDQAVNHANPDSEWACLPPVSWRSNRTNGGVWIEYPVCPCGAGYNPVWDEYDGDPEEPEFGDAPPTYERCIEMGLVPEYVLDIALQHKGVVCTAIEVVWRHPTPLSKRLDLEHRGIEVIEVSAYWILSQLGKPKALKLYERLPYEKAA